jgi:hypothetical protein
MARPAAQLSCLIAAVVIGVGVITWALRPPGEPALARDPGSRPGSAIVVHLDGEGRPFVPDEPPDVSEQNARDAIANAAALEEQLPQVAPGGGEMVVVGNHLRHYSVARRAGGSGVHIGCAAEPPRAAGAAGDE